MIKDKVDSRVYRTRRDLKEVFVKLLLERKDLRKISIKEITELSHYNRSTFYAHFLDKDDILYEVMNDMIHGFTDVLKVNLSEGESYRLETLPGHTIEIFNYIEDHDDLFSFLFLNSNMFGFQERLTKALENVLLTEFTFMSVEENHIDKNIFVKMKANVILSHIAFWIENGFKDSTDYMNEQLIKNINAFSQEFVLHRN